MTPKPLNSGKAFTVLCPVCGVEFADLFEAQKGRPRVFCAPACRQWWYRWGAFALSAGWDRSVPAKHYHYPPQPLPAKRNTPRGAE